MSLAQSGAVRGPWRGEGQAYRPCRSCSAEAKATHDIYFPKKRGKDGENRAARLVLG